MRKLASPAARDKILPQLQSAERAVRGGSDAEFDAAMKDLDGSISAIEEYTKKQEK